MDAGEGVGVQTFRSIDQFLAHLVGVRQTEPRQWMARCPVPAHSDHKASLAIRLDGNKILVHCHAGCRTEDVVRVLGLTMRDLFLDELKHEENEGVTLPQLARAKGIDVERLKEFGLTRTTYQNKPAVSMAYYDERHNKLTTNLRISLHEEPRFHAPRGQERELYGLNWLPTAKERGYVVLCEGESDAWTCWLHDIPCIGVPGSNGWKSKWRSRFDGIPVVYGVQEGDQAGPRLIKSLLASFGARLHVIPFQKDVKDINALYLKDTAIFKQSFRALMKQAKALVSAPAGSIAATPAKITTAECLEAVNRWLLLPDNVVVRYLLALVIANRLPGDPVWGFIVAPSGAAKTELLNSLNAVPEIYPLSDLTPNTFLSGYKRNEKASLLKKLQPGTILTVKDFTTVLSMHRDSRQAILSQLREIADGSYRKEFGTGESVVWEGKLGFIAGCTPVIDQHQSVYGLLGERFLQIRPPLPRREALAKAARSTVGKETQMRSELREAMAGCIAGIEMDQSPQWPEDLSDALDSLATLVALARSGTVRDPYHKELQLTPEPEVPTRLVKQLYKLGQALAMLRGATTVEPEDFVIVQQVATDTISHTRWRILSYLLEQADEVTTSDVATAVGLPTSTTRRHLDDLVGLTLVDGDKRGSGVATKWRVSVECADLIAKSLTLPQISPHGGEGEIKEEEEDELYTLPTSVERLPAIVSNGDSRPFHGEDLRSHSANESSGRQVGATVVAESRTRVHLGHRSTRPLSDAYDLVGAAGEVAFAEEFGLEVDAEERPAGDHGIDFQTPAGTIDVKTYRKPHHLLREVDKPHADILVLAGFDDATGEAELIGWEWDTEMVKCPRKDFGYGILNHYKLADELKPISELHELIACEESVPF